MCVYFVLDFQEMIVFKTPKQHKKSAAEGGGLLRLFFRLLYNHFLEVQNKIYTYWVYLMEHICFEVQLCIEISIFNQFCEIPAKNNIWELHQVTVCEDVNSSCLYMVVHVEYQPLGRPVHPPQLRAVWIRQQGIWQEKTHLPIGLLKGIEARDFIKILIFFLKAS